MEPPCIIPSTASVVISASVVRAAPIVIAATVMITTTVVVAAAGAGVTPGIGIPTTAGVGSRSRTTPTTAAPSHGVGRYEKRCHAGGYSENEYFAQHSNINRFSR
jgi:hypothetical protein